MFVQGAGCTNSPALLHFYEYPPKLTRMCPMIGPTLFQNWSEINHPKLVRTWSEIDSNLVQHWLKLGSNLIRNGPKLGGGRGEAPVLKEGEGEAEVEFLDGGMPFGGSNR